MKTLLQYLYTGKSLTEEEARIALKDIASGNQNDAQVAAFLSVYNLRIPTTQEMTGFVKAMQELSVPLKFKHKNILDIVGTGGDGKDTFNISTLAAFVCAGTGVKVAKHGNYSVSSVSGSSNVLEQLGIVFTDNQQKLNEQLDAANITFLHAPLFHPAMKNVANVRRQLQVKTIFNLLGPLVNPCNPHTRLIGVHSEFVGKLYKEVLLSTNAVFAVVHSLDGYDEISLTGDTRIFLRKKMQIHEPKSFGFPLVRPEELHGGKTVAANAKVFMDILKGKGTVAQQHVVLANAALAISLYNENSYPAALEMAKHSLFDGKALQCFNVLKQIK
ncbi:MAG: anthranilate phosphoribosyltransferase [Chitinophagales bacterium]